jgi:hypothetical protein
MLAGRGLVISAGKMSGLWSGDPASIKLSGLDVICAVLGCGVGELLIPGPGRVSRGAEQDPARALASPRLIGTDPECAMAGPGPGLAGRLVRFGIVFDHAKSHAGEIVPEEDLLGFSAGRSIFARLVRSREWIPALGAVGGRGDR